VNYRYSLAGFMTFFFVYSPSKKLKSGNILRICQALVLSPYQCQGHGKTMMRAVYDYAKRSYNDILKSVHMSMSTIRDQDRHEENYHANPNPNNGDGDGGDSISQKIVEVNVEDPAPGFTLMRNAIDYELFEAMVTDAVVSDSESDDDLSIKGILN